MRSSPFPRAGARFPRAQGRLQSPYHCFWYPGAGRGRRNPTPPRDRGSEDLVSRPEMTDEEAFLDALAEDPDDDATRLVYADWLEERGEEGRALYLRKECELAALPGEGERRTSRQCGQALLLRFRLAQLRKGLDPAWLG